jgi:hypothetical protein
VLALRPTAAATRPPGVTLSKLPLPAASLRATPRRLVARRRECRGRGLRVAAR